MTKNNEQINYMWSCNGSKSKLMIVDSLRTCKLSSISGKRLSPSVDLKYIYQDIITENISNPHNLTVKKQNTIHPICRNDILQN